jgi:tetratricopeptide (TPR) repeat protein
MSEDRKKQYLILFDGLNTLGLKDPKGAVKKAKEIAKEAKICGDYGYDFLFASEALAYAGNLEKAKQVANKAVCILTEVSFVLSNYGAINLSLRQYDEANEYLEKALSIDPECIHALVHKGVLLANQDRHNEAIEYYDKVSSIDSEYIHALSSKGSSFVHLGKYDEALKCYDKVLSIDSEILSAINNKGATLAILNRNDEALECYDKVLSIDPENKHALFSKGSSLTDLGQHAEALEYYDKVLSIDAEYPDVLTNKGISLTGLGQHDKAIEYYDKALLINSKDIHALSNKGVSLAKLGRDKEAFKYYDIALSIYPEDRHSLTNKGVSLAKLGRDKEALECYDKVLSIDPEYFHALRNKGASLAAIGQYEDAIKLYKNSQKIKPWDEIDLNWIVEIYLKLKKLEDAEAAAIKWIETLTEKRKTTKVAEFLLRQIEIKLGKIELPSPQEQELNEFIEKVIKEFRKDTFHDQLTEIERKEKEINKFIEESDKSKKILTSPQKGFLSILRKWNSYTPIMSLNAEDSKGGGYFFYFGGKGIIIDPGFDFLRNFFREGFKLADVDYIFITHAHLDHMADLEALFSLLHERNERIDEENEKRDKSDQLEHKKIDLFLNLGTMKKLSGWINLMETYFNRIHVLEAGQKLNLNSLTVLPTRAKHHEIVDNIYSLGFVFESEGIKIGFTGDTGWDLKESIAEPFKGCDLLIAHLGGILRKELDEKTLEKRLYKNHLGLLGMSLLLKEVRPELCIVSEFGEELDYQREEISEILTKVLGVKCIPADIGTEIGFSDDPLEKLLIRCAICGKFRPKDECIYETYQSQVLYYCGDCRESDKKF